MKFTVITGVRAARQPGLVRSFTVIALIGAVISLVAGLLANGLAEAKLNALHPVGCWSG